MSKDNPYQGYHAQLLEKLERLERKNAALRERLEQLQDFAVLVLRGLDSGYIRSKPFIDTSDDNATEYPVRTLEEIARAALARKEAQP